MTKTTFYRSAVLGLLLATSQTPTAHAGSVARYFYDGISLSTDSAAIRTGVSTLTNAAIFPNSPTRREQLDDFNTGPGTLNWALGLQGKNNDLTDWGSWIPGYIEAPETGSYVFYISSDDNSELWLSTDHTSANKQRIAFESKYGDPLFSGARLSERASVPINLIRGSKYYFEVLHKQGGGGSYLQVGWKRPDGVQEIIPALHVAQSPIDPFLGATDPNVPPTANFFGFNGGDLPSTVSTNEGGSVLLQLDIIAAQPTSFQWLSNGVPIAGENLSYLSIPRVHYNANNAVIQAVVSNEFGVFNSAQTTLSITPDTTAPTVLSVDPRGNPNRVRVTFSEPVSPETATNLVNYLLQVQGGSTLAIQSVLQLPDQQSVELSGSFNFQLGKSYTLRINNIQDQADNPVGLAPNPATISFSFVPPTGTLYDFNAGVTNGFALIGSALLHSSGSYDGSGFVGLTEASAYQNGALIFTNVGTVDQFRIQFKTRLGDASAIPGDGFSVNLAGDLPSSAFAEAQNGYLPFLSSGADRFIVAFENKPGSAAPSIAVKWRGVVLTNVIAGVNGNPALNNADGHWANVDIQLKRDGKLTVVFDGVVVINQFSTGFTPVQNAKLGIAAQTSSNYETHWFDDINVNYADGDIGAVGFSSNSPLSDVTALENRPVRLSVIATGASPFNYQWYHEGTPVAGATGSYLDVIANAASVGNYWVVVSNDFSYATSVTARLTVQADTAAPHVVSVRGYAAGINQVRLVFDEPIDPATATNTTTYNLGFLSLTNVVLNPDGHSVTLYTGNLQRDQVYTFSINGLKDLSLAGNSLTTSVGFIGESGYPGEVLYDSPVRYFRFDETNGSATVSSLVSSQDALTNAYATLNNAPTLGAPSLVPSQQSDYAIGLNAANSQNVIVPNGADLNITSGPWAKKSIELWFNAASVPAPGTTGLSAATALWEQGGVNRGLALYLWRDPASADPEQAQLVFHGWNNIAADGAGSPWGTIAGLATPPIYTKYPIQAGQTYHVVAVMDGDSAGTNGNLILYLNGVEVSRIGGVGQLYAHSSDNQIGKGNTLLHTGESGGLAYFNGVIDDVSAYNIALSPARVAAHYQAGLIAPQLSGNSLNVTRVDTRGNPNQILVTFNQPIALASATNVANFSLKNALGVAIPIQTATLLGGDQIVQLSGSFNFQVNSNYTLTVGSINDQSVPPKGLVTNPTNITWSFTAPLGTSYSFNSGQPSGILVFGKAGFVANGSYDGSGYLRLTDATNSQNGAVLFVERHDVEAFHLQFKALLTNDGTTPAEGFSVNLASDLPSGTFSTPEEGYLPAASPNADRLIISFDNYSDNTADLSPSIAVKWRGITLTNILTGTNGIPSLSSADGHWANVDINLKRGGLLSVSYDGVNVINALATGFESLSNAQIGLGARTGTYYETHWFDDFNINYTEGQIGPVSIASNGQPQGTNTLENRLVQLSVLPIGVGPFAYQWYYKNAPLPGATSRVLAFSASTNVTGSYYVTVSNAFSSVTSSQAVVSVQTDVVPPSIVKVQAIGGGVNQVRLTFDKPLDPAATNLLNYTISQLLVNNVTLSTNGLVVTLYTYQQVNNATYSLGINSVQDRASFPNVLRTNLTFQSTLSYAEESLFDGPVRYYRFDETNGVTAYSQTSLLDTLATAQGTYVGNPLLGVPGLVPNNAGGTAVQLSSINTNKITFLNGSDVNATAGPWSKKTVEFWFKATSLPKGGGGTNTQAAPLFIEGAGNRSLTVYLYGTDSNSLAPSTAQLVWGADNNPVEKNGGGGWGVTNGHPELAVYVAVPVTTNQIYHVVAVFDGGTNSSGQVNGRLLLYTNGVLAGTAAGAGVLYNHTGATPRVGNSTSGLRHDGLLFNAGDFIDGVIDDLVLYNKVLSPDRVTAHYAAGLTAAPVVVVKPVFGTVGRVDRQFQVNWSGTARLQRATNVTGPYIDVTGANGSYQEPPTTGQVFFRLAQ